MSEKEDLIQLKQSDLAGYKKKKYEEQGGICPILGIKAPLEDFVVDHCHRKKSEKIGNNNGGLVRGVIHRQANSWEGKVANNYIRYGLHNLGVDLCDALEGLLNFYKNYKTNLIHPSEKEKEPKIQKSCFNELIKKMNKSGWKGKLPTFPASGKLSKKMDELFKKYNVQVKYLKGK